MFIDSSNNLNNYLLQKEENKLPLNENTERLLIKARLKTLIAFRESPGLTRTSKYR